LNTVQLNTKCHAVQCNSHDSMKKVLITQSNYIPWKGYFDSINMVDEFVVYDDMQFTKRDWRNRNLIKTAQGLHWLSIPIKTKGSFFQKINESEASEPDWGIRHWKNIVHNYSKAPFFEEYKSAFEPLYLSNPNMLTDINVSFIRAVCDILGIETKISFSHDFELAEGKTERLVSLCQQIGATDYYTGPAAKNYMDEALFEQSSINVHYFDYQGYAEYPQLYPPFEHGVTILDLIFNTGSQAKRYLKSFT
jgi:WbqC-like protein family